jgi:hypothetical protein
MYVDRYFPEQAEVNPIIREIRYIILVTPFWP